MQKTQECPANGRSNSIIMKRYTGSTGFLVKDKGIPIIEQQKRVELLRYMKVNIRSKDILFLTCQRISPLAKILRKYFFQE